MTLSSRERVRRAVEFEGVDRVPIMHAVLPAAWFKFGQRLNKILEKYPRDLAAKGKGGKPATAGYKYTKELAQSININDDFSYLEARTYQYGEVGQKGRSTDEWGCIWERIDSGIVGQVVQHPLERWEKVKEYRFPDALAYWRFDLPQIDKTVQQAKEEQKYIIAYGGNLFELLQWLRGYENLMIDIMQEPERVRYLAEKIVEYNLKTVERWMEFEVDAILFQDDWGTQKQLMIPPHLWRDIFKPYYARLFALVHRAGRHVHFHTDGFTLNIIPDLIEIGVDVLNPQFSTMNLEQLAQMVAGKVCLRSDIDRQYILNRASPEEVKDYIKRVLKLFSSSQGGLIAYGEVNSDASLENVETMYEAWEQFGRYQ